MGIIQNVLRSVWIPSLHEITGSVTAGLGPWIESRGYQISQVIYKNKFTLDVPAFQPLLMAYAADINRMSAAAFETVLGVQKHPVTSKATGWLMIQAYYASFFAAHALLRMSGTSCTQIDSLRSQSIGQTARKFGQLAAPFPDVGNYTLVLDQNTSRLHCTLNSQQGGAHQALWRVFANALARWSQDVLLVQNELTVNKQAVSAKLTELSDKLSFGGNANATWLTQVRNSINYRHAFGCWYPYRYDRGKSVNHHEKLDTWLKDPMLIDLSVTAEDDLRGFQNVCLMIVALCRSMTRELANRCPKKSFVTQGALAFLNLANVST
jgi:hypothetical protein